jgi:hypothetical protein
VVLQGVYAEGVFVNVDKYGFIGQIQDDGSVEGGDSACWTGHWILLGGEGQSMSKFEVKPGAYVRHPVPEQTNNGFGAYYESPWRGCISRDQLTGIMCGLIGEGDCEAMSRLVLHWALSGFLFSYNTIHNGRVPGSEKPKLPDFTGPEMWALAIRGLKWGYLLYPLLVIFDLHMLISTVIRRLTFDKDPINYTGRLIVSQERLPTPISRLTWALCDKVKLRKEIRGYWCGWRDSCEMEQMSVNRLGKL